MSARSKSETAKGSAPGPTLDEQRTAIFEAGKHAKKGAVPPSSPDIDPTLVDGPNAGPTLIDTPRAPIVAISKKEPSSSFQAISMKTPGHGLAAPQGADRPTPIVPRPKLRASAEPAAHAKSLGNLAPPYDPKEARARSVREYVIWGCLAVIIASAIALVVWFAAR